MKMDHGTCQQVESVPDLRILLPFLKNFVDIEKRTERRIILKNIANFKFSNLPKLLIVIISLITYNLDHLKVWIIYNEFNPDFSGQYLTR